MNNESVNQNESSTTDDSSTSSDDDYLKNLQVPQEDKNFEDINEFWNTTNIVTPKHATISSENLVKPPHLSVPMKSKINQMFSYQPTPPRPFQNPMNKLSNSPIYVGSSTDETPRRSYSNKSSVSSDDSSNEYSSDSSDGITFIDTPITDKLKQSPPENTMITLSPITSNKNEKSAISDNTKSDSYYSSTESDVSADYNQNNILSSNEKDINEKNNTSSYLAKNQEITQSVNSTNIISNNISDVPLPMPSILSDSGTEDTQDNSENSALINVTQNPQPRNIEKQILNPIKNQGKRNQTTSKPAFASPKRSSNGVKKETIITELSPSTSMRRKKAESARIPDFKLSQLDQEDEGMIVNEITETNSIQNNEDNKPVMNGDNDINTEKNIINNNFNSIVKNTESSDDDNDIKKIERLAKKDPLRKKTIDMLITEEDQRDLSSTTPNDEMPKKDKIENKTKAKQNKSPSMKKVKQNYQNNEKVENLKTEDESPPQKTRSKSANKSKNKSESQPIKTKSKVTEKKSMSNTKSEIKTESQPPNPKSSKADKTKQNKAKAKGKNSPKIRYDFSINSDEISDDDRISTLVQIPNDTDKNSAKKGTTNDEDDSDLPIALRRRKRVIVKPLKFWCGEHIVYGLSEDGFQTFQNLSIPEKMRKLDKGESRVMMKEQKRILAKKENDRKISRVEGNGIVVFDNKVIDFEKSNEVVLKKGVKCSVVCKGDSPLIFKIEEI